MPYLIERFREVHEDMEEVLLVLEVLLAQYPKVEDLLCCAALWSEACLFLSDDIFRLRLQSVQQDLQRNFARVAEYNFQKAPSDVFKDMACRIQIKRSCFCSRRPFWMSGHVGFVIKYDIKA